MILLTGGTGFLGREVLGRLLLSIPDSRFVLIVRPNGTEDVSLRIQQVLAETFSPEQAAQLMERIEVVAGDMTLEKFGMADSEFDQLASRIHTIYHGAASTSLKQPIEEAWPINVQGTAQTVRLAELADSKIRNGSSHVSHTDSSWIGDGIRMNHISTAYVAGDTKEVVTPDQLNLSVNFRNGYERSKAEAEMLVRAMDENVSRTIFRPSVIVGDSVTGQTSAFNVVYIPAKFLSKGFLHAVPASPNIPFDIVPVDYVADAVAALGSMPKARGRCYHLTAGLGRETSPIEILDILIHTVNEYRNHCSRRGLKKLPFIPIDELLALAEISLTAARSSVKNFEKFFGKRLDVILQTLPFVPYMMSNPRFEATDTFTDLNGVLPQPPLFKLYAERLFKYCLETNWGKIPWENPHNRLIWHERPNRVAAAFL